MREKPVVVYPDTLSKRLFNSRVRISVSLNALIQKKGMAPMIPRKMNTSVSRMHDCLKSSSSRTDMVFRKKPKKKNAKLVMKRAIIAWLSSYMNPIPIGKAMRIPASCITRPMFASTGRIRYNFTWIYIKLSYYHYNHHSFYELCESFPYFTILFRNWFVASSLPPAPLEFMLPARGWLRVRVMDWFH